MCYLYDLSFIPGVGTRECCDIDYGVLTDVHCEALKYQSSCPSPLIPPPGRPSLAVFVFFVSYFIFFGLACITAGRSLSFSFHFRLWVFFDTLFFEFAARTIHSVLLSGLEFFVLLVFLPVLLLSATWES